MACAIYKIESTCGKLYVGSSTNFLSRKACHLSRLKANGHHSPYLQNYYNKHGKESLQFILIEEIDAVLQLEREQYWINTLKPVFNMESIAGLPPNHKGRKRSQETIQRMSTARSGIKLTDEHKRTISRNHGKRKLSLEQVQEIYNMTQNNIKNKDIAALYNIDASVVSRIKNKERGYSYGLL
jgi:group I intron endonuclease